MKRTLKLFIAFILVFASIVAFSSLSFADGPELESPEAPVEIEEVVVTPGIFDGSGNQYGETPWPSFSAAQAYYGFDFTYGSCSKWFNGLYYNYFYYFSNGTKMFFRVL